jgi:hypothetical protein
MALQLQLFWKSTHNWKLFDADNVWGQFGRLVLITKAPSWNLAYWREMMKKKVPVDLHTLQPDISLLRPEVKWKLDPRK